MLKIQNLFKIYLAAGVRFKIIIIIFIIENLFNVSTIIIKNRCYVLSVKFLKNLQYWVFLLEEEFRKARAAYDARRRAEIHRREERERRNREMGLP